MPLLLADEMLLLIGGGQQGKGKGSVMQTHPEEEIKWNLVRSTHFPVKCSQGGGHCLQPHQIRKLWGLDTVISHDKIWSEIPAYSSFLPFKFSTPWWCISQKATLPQYNRFCSEKGALEIRSETLVLLPVKLMQLTPCLNVANLTSCTSQDY